jgi:hypothetical protein
MTATTERSRTMPLGVVIERQPSASRWQRWRWAAVGVMPGAPPVAEWRELVREGEVVRWHAATLPLELHRTATADYRYNLSGKVPSVYVVLRRQHDPERELRPILVTISPGEAQSYGEFGDDVVEAVPMSEGLIAWVQEFVDRHHVDRPFHKRKRKRADPEALGARGALDRGGGRDGRA